MKNKRKSSLASTASKTRRFHWAAKRSEMISYSLFLCLDKYQKKTLQLPDCFPEDKCKIRKLIKVFLASLRCTLGETVSQGAIGSYL